MVPTLRKELNATLFGSWIAEKVLSAQERSTTGIVRLQHQEHKSLYSYLYEVPVVKRDGPEDGVDEEEYLAYKVEERKKITAANKLLRALKPMQTGANLLPILNTQYLHWEDSSSFGCSLLLHTGNAVPLVYDQTKGEMSESQICRLGIDLCLALHVIHSAGLVHGDVSVNNVFKKGEDGYLLGFTTTRSIWQKDGDEEEDITALGLLMENLLRNHRNSALNGPIMGAISGEYRDADEFAAALESVSDMLGEKTPDGAAIYVSEAASVDAEPAPYNTSASFDDQAFSAEEVISDKLKADMEPDFGCPEADEKGRIVPDDFGFGGLASSPEPDLGGPANSGPDFGGSGSEEFENHSPGGFDFGDPTADQMTDLYGFSENGFQSTSGADFHKTEPSHIPYSEESGTSDFSDQITEVPFGDTEDEMAPEHTPNAFRASAPPKKERSENMGKKRPTQEKKPLPPKANTRIKQKETPGETKEKRKKSATVEKTKGADLRRQARFQVVAIIVMAFLLVSIVDMVLFLASDKDRSQKEDAPQYEQSVMVSTQPEMDSPESETVITMMETETPEQSSAPAEQEVPEDTAAMTPESTFPPEPAATQESTSSPELATTPEPTLPPESTAQATEAPAAVETMAPSAETEGATETTPAALAEEKEKNTPSDAIEVKNIAAAGWSSYILWTDGTVSGYGRNQFQQTDVGGWQGIEKISGGDSHVLGLSENGTVYAAGWNEYGQCNVENWADITDISAGTYHSVALKKDGTAVAVGRNGHGQCNVSQWKDLKQVTAGELHTIALLNDGKVIACGDNQYGQCNVYGWRDIVAVATGVKHTVGLKSDGTVVAVGSDNRGQCQVSQWQNVTKICCGDSLTVALHSDGTVSAVGYNEHGQCNVQNWTDIVDISTRFGHTIGLKKDGTLITTGRNEFGECNLSSRPSV